MMESSSELMLWKLEVVATLRKMVEDWEETMGVEDKTYYSLALRRAIDVVQGTSSMDQLPILEKPDTVIDSE